MSLILQATIVNKDTGQVEKVHVLTVDGDAGAEYRGRIAEADLPEHVREAAIREVDRLEQRFARQEANLGRRGQQVRDALVRATLVFDAEKVAVFDAKTGVNLSR